MHLLIMLSIAFTLINQKLITLIVIITGGHNKQGETAVLRK